MTKIVSQKILEKFQKLDEYLNNLKILRKEIKNEGEFIKDFRAYGAVERYLQLSCQAALDIIDLVIIEENFQKPEDRHEAISILFNQKIVSDNLAQKLQNIAGFRNILVHEYGKIDRKKVYKILKERLGDLEEFKKQIINFLKKK